MSAICKAPNPAERDDRPKALRYEDRINAMEEMILDGLPEVIAKLMSMAKDGNIPAARYLIDRMAGRPSRLPLPPSIDKSLPYTSEDWISDKIIRKEQRDSKTAAHIRSLYRAAKEEDGFPDIGSSPSLENMQQMLAYWNVSKMSGRRNANSSMRR